MFDWLWTYWSPTSVFFYFSGGLWVLAAFRADPLMIDGRRCKTCEVMLLMIWPVLMPAGFLLMFINWLRSKLGRSRTFI